MRSFRLVIWLLALVAGFSVAGCSRIPIRVVVDPPGAVVNIVEMKSDSSKSKEYEFSGEPGIVKLSRSEGISEYTFKASFEGYQNQIQTLTLSDLERLPVDEDDDVRVLRIDLENEYVLLPELIVVYDSGLGEFVGRIRSARAYEETTEAGVPVGRVFDDIRPGCGIRGIGISPDGTRLVFAEAVPQVASSAPGRDSGATVLVPLESCNLKMIQLHQRGEQRVAGGVMHLTQGRFRDLDPTFTPDGEHIRFASNRRRKASADILQISAQARRGGIQDVYVDNRGFAALGPSVGKDRTTVFGLSGKGGRGDTEIWSVGGHNEFPTEIASGTQPQISPDGTWIAYIGTDQNLWVIQTDGTSPTQLTFRAAEILEEYSLSLRKNERDGFDPDLLHPYSHPSWSRDGQKIAFSSMEGLDDNGRHNQDIWTMSVDGTQPIQLTSNGSADSQPLFGSDGEFLYFLSNRGQRWAIWSIRVQ